jgi:fused signal recognition particle receptor
MSFLKLIKKGLTKSRESIVREVTNIMGSQKITENSLDELEERLIRSDVGVEAAFLLVDTLRERALGKSLTAKEALDLLAESALDLLPEDGESLVFPKDEVKVILIIGVNGAGKTTSIGKMAKWYKDQGNKVMLAAGDTFRAAAIEQLEGWAARSDVEVVKHAEGSDAAAVVYDAYEAAKARGCNVLIADTAGRLHNKLHLMEELKKMSRVLKKVDESAPHQTLLVIDGNTGQNVVNQTRVFNEQMPLDGLVVTKLDGTAKGGAVLAIANELQIPVKWIGVGEAIDDWAPFNKEDYVKSLFEGAEL